MSTTTESNIKCVVHRITLGDVDDPELYIAMPLYDWQYSDEGSWIMTHSVETPYWRTSPFPFTSYGIQYDVVAVFTPKDHTFWMLKWGADKR